MLAAWSGGTMSRTMARESAMPEAIAACAMRKPRKTSIVGAKRQPTVATRNSPKQASSTGRRP